MWVLNICLCICDFMCWCTWVWAYVCARVCESASVSQSKLELVYKELYQHVHFRFAYIYIYISPNEHIYLHFIFNESVVSMCTGVHLCMCICWIKISMPCWTTDFVPGNLFNVLFRITLWDISFVRMAARWDNFIFEIWMYELK